MPDILCDIIDNLCPRKIETGVRTLEQESIRLAVHLPKLQLIFCWHDAVVKTDVLLAESCSAMPPQNCLVSYAPNLVEIRLGDSATLKRATNVASQQAMPS